MTACDAKADAKTDVKKELSLVSIDSGNVLKEGQYWLMVSTLETTNAAWRNSRTRHRRPFPIVQSKSISCQTLDFLSLKQVIDQLMEPRWRFLSQEFGSTINGGAYTFSSTLWFQQGSLWQGIHLWIAAATDTDLGRIEPVWDNWRTLSNKHRRSISQLFEPAAVRQSMTHLVSPAKTSAVLVDVEKSDVISSSSANSSCVSATVITSSTTKAFAPQSSTAATATNPLVRLSGRHLWVVYRRNQRVSMDADWVSGPDSVRWVDLLSPVKSVQGTSKSKDDKKHSVNQRETGHLWWTLLNYLLHLPATPKMTVYCSFDGDTPSLALTLIESNGVEHFLTLMCLQSKTLRAIQRAIVSFAQTHNYMYHVF